MNISAQAYTILIVYIVLILVIAITGAVKSGVTVAGVFSTIFAMCWTALLAYDTACLSDNNCGVWSWIRTVLYIIVPCILLITIMVGFASSKKTPEEQQAPPVMPPMMS